MLSPRDFEALFHDGLRYRYSEERWQTLAHLGGHPFRSLTERKNGYIEELIQPTVLPIELESGEIADLEKLGVAWSQLQRVQMQLSRSLDAFPWVRPFMQRIMTPTEWGNSAQETGCDVISPFTRLDCVRTPDGFKVVDINSTRPAGVGDIVVEAEAFAREGWNVFPIGKTFSEVMRACFDEWSCRIGRQAPARIAVLAEEGDGDWWNCKILADILARETWVECAEVRDTVPNPSHGFTMILRNRIKEGHSLFPALAAISADTACVVSPLHRRWIGNKEWMAAFHMDPMAADLASLLGKETFEFVKQHFLPTGKIVDGMLQLNNTSVPVHSLVKRDWMVKPPRGSSGQGITIGRSATVGAWRAACAEGALVQEFRRVKETMWVLDALGAAAQDTFYTKYGVFIFNGATAGIEVMARKQALVHGARDTYLTVAVLPKTAT